jgi:predicted esterase
MSRPEIREVSANLLLGNRQLFPSSPFLTALLTPAWNADDMVYGLKALCSQAKAGEQVYYEVYTEKEQKEDPAKKTVGLYCLHGDSSEKKPYVLLFAGGGFSSVCTFCESLPVGEVFRELGYTVFMGTYRLTGVFGQFQDPEILAEDIAREISFINEHAEEWNLETENYLIGGFSAGSCTAATWCDPRYGYEAYGTNPPAAYCSMYGIVEDYIDYAEIPAFIRFCKDDEYFDLALPERYTAALSEKNIPFNSKTVDCLHGFGLGTGTEAEGWVNEAEVFWKSVLENKT